MATCSARQSRLIKTAVRAERLDDAWRFDRAARLVDCAIQRRLQILDQVLDVLDSDR